MLVRIVQVIYGLLLTMASVTTTAENLLFSQGKILPIILPIPIPLTCIKASVFLPHLAKVWLPVPAIKFLFYNPGGNPNSQITYGLILNDSSTLIARLYSNTIEMFTGTKKTIIKPPPEIGKKMKSFLMFMKDAENNIWIGTDAGVYVYKKGNFNAPYIIPVLFGKYCNVLKVDFEGNVFIASEHDVYKVYKQHLKNIENAQPVKFATHKDQITAMGFSRNGDILVFQFTLWYCYL